MIVRSNDWRGPRLAIPVMLMSIACLTTSGFSATVASESLSEVAVVADMATFEPQIRHSGVRVTISGPDGFEVVESFGADGGIAVALPGTDGLYKYELRFSQALDPLTRAQLAAAREFDSAASGGPGGDREADRRTVQRGWFSLLGGSLVGAEREAAGTRKGAGPVAGPGTVSAAAILPPTQEVVLTNGDGVIRNSLCVGFDCPDAPLFDDSTILMMENNTRIKFGDTSNAPFPNNDWEIEANSNLSGGLNYLGFNDCGSADNDGGCADDLVFAVEAGTRASALYVEDDGDVGIGTSLPVLDLHIVTGDTPSLRLDQDGSSGFAPQVWDIAGNETNFFVRDVTAGSLLPLRIRPGAPTSSIDIMASGVVMKNGLIVEAPCSGCDSIFEPGRRLASIEEHAALMRSNRYLPGVGPTPDGLVALNVPEKITGILQELEIAHIYIEQLHAHLREVQERLATLEARQRGGAGGGT